MTRRPNTASSAVAPFDMPSIPAVDAAAEIARQAAVAAELARYLRDGGPTSKELEEAPLITDWSVTVAGRYVAVLTGTVWRHPYIRHGGHGHTSQIVAMAKDRTWARSSNRLWALGRPLPGDGAGHA